MTEDENQVCAAEDARYRALLDADVEALSALLHERLSYTHSTGGRDNRASLLAKITEGRLVYREVAHPVDEVTVVGDTAIVVGKMIASIAVDGTEVTLNNAVLSVWVRTPADWRLLAFQPTPLRNG